jgi:3-oxoacyl-[acyl-carrier protein] reductase
MRLKDKVAVVTGGARGIGRGICEAFAAEGAKVVAIYRGSQAAAEEMAAGIVAKGGVAKTYQADVSDLAQIKTLFETIEKEVGPVDILVNNAGIIHDDLFVRMEPADWLKVVHTNLFGTYNCCHQIAFAMMRRRAGRIINVSSVAADFVNMGQTNYAASKGAIDSFTKALAVELAPRGVTVNAIAPGFIETDMSSAVLNKAGDIVTKMIPMRRLGKPEDIARVAVFLASAEGGYMTGQVLTVDGGLSLGPTPPK